MLLREAADETIKKLWKMAPHFSSILLRIKDCYNNCIKTALSDYDMKNKEIKKWKKEVGEIKQKLNDFSTEIEQKEVNLMEAKKEILKLKKAKKETEKNYDKMEKYAEDMKQKSGLFFGKYSQDKVLKEIKDCIKENEDVKCIARELKSEIEYGKQRENKLMYFLFLMQQKEYPVFEIFEEHIKDLPTSRFSTNLDDKFKEIYMEQKKRMKEMGLIGDFDMACTERAHKLGKLDKETEMSFFTDESYEPINAGPAPQLNKPQNIPGLNFKLMNQNLEKERQKAKEGKPRKQRKGPSSNYGRRANSQDNSNIFPEMFDQINHNKYGKRADYKEDEEYKEILKNQVPQEYRYEEYNEGESSPWTWSYCLRKEQGKGGIEELIAMNGFDQDSENNNVNSFHSSILHERPLHNQDKYKNIKELRRLYEVMNSYEEP